MLVILRWNICCPSIKDQNIILTYLGWDLGHQKKFQMANWLDIWADLDKHRKNYFVLGSCTCTATTDNDVKNEKEVEDGDEDG